MTKIATAVLLTVSIAHTAWPAADQAVPHGNPRRTGWVPHNLKPPYRVAWVYADRHRPRPAWREPGWEPQRIDFDYAYAVSAAGGLVYFGSSADHALHALYLGTGRVRWTFFTEGPVRLAAEFHGGRVLFGSDDGCLYCLDGTTGRLVWKTRLGIPDKRLIGNEQLISRWAVRSGVVVEGDRVYAAFGMLSPEGVAVCCLDARSGKPIWINDTCGYHYMARPHVFTMGGVSPHGYMAVEGDTLVVACGRSTPALFDRNTGKLRYHEADGDFTGGAWTMAHRDLVFTPAHTLRKEWATTVRTEREGESKVSSYATLVALDRRTGYEVFSLRGGAKGILSDTGLLTVGDGSAVFAVDLQKVRGSIGKRTSIRNTAGHYVTAKGIAKWTAKVDRAYALVQARDTIIVGGPGKVEAFDAGSGKSLWTGKVEGQARTLLAAPGRLIVSTTTGRIYCLEPGEPTGAPEPVVTKTVDLPENAEDTRLADSVLSAGRIRGGYCLAAGKMSVGLLAALAKKSDLTIYGAWASDDHLDAARRELHRAGLYGTRIALHRITGPTLPYNDFFADLVVVRGDTAEEMERIAISELYRVLRPCGGAAVFMCPRGVASRVEQALTRAGVPKSEIRGIEGGLKVVRGALEGAGEWTHQYGTAGKTCASTERRVKLPLKAASFGGLGPAKIVSRHFRAPSPLVAEGRCFTIGADHLMAFNIYNGREIWQREFKDLAHWPAHARGPAAVVDRQRVYALQEQRLLVLDAATGKTVAEYQAPIKEANLAQDGKSLIWEYLAVVEDVIIGSIGEANARVGWWSRAAPVNYVVFGMDKNTGKLLWLHCPENVIVSNGIAVDQGRVFIVDGRPVAYGVKSKKKKRKGEKEPAPVPQDTKPRTVQALDLRTGKVLWKNTELGPSIEALWAADGILLASVIPYPRSKHVDRKLQGNIGLVAFDAEDGRKLWALESFKKFTPLITDGKLYTPLAYDLKTGTPIMNEAENKQFSADMAMLCSSLSGCPTLAMSRQSSLGVRDLAQHSGVYQYPIVRASCWISMIPAGGLIMVPEGSSSCLCAYNYKTSLALMSDERHFHYVLTATLIGHGHTLYSLTGSGLPGPPSPPRSP
ncbi:MAG: outer membrane protein assembly factor BamB family protein [Planctomycetota bacterium]